MTTITKNTSIDAGAAGTDSGGFAKALFATEAGYAPLLLRLGLAATLFPHGAQKLLGWWGGYGFQGTMGFFTGMMHLPWIIGVLTIIGEFFGSIALALGLFTRFTAASVIAIMVGAITTVHYANGFFMNWTGQQKGEGWEYHLLVITIAVALLVRGAGSLSADQVIAGKMKK